MTTPDAYWEEAHAAFHRLAAEDARIWVDAEPEPGPDEPVPFTLTGQAEAALDGTEPEPLPDPDPEVGGWVGWSDRSMLAPDLEPEAEP